LIKQYIQKSELYVLIKLKPSGYKNNKLVMKDFLHINIGSLMW